MCGQTQRLTFQTFDLLNCNAALSNADDSRDTKKSVYSVLTYAHMGVARACQKNDDMSSRWIVFSPV